VKQPGYFFYTGDWMKDPKIRILTLAARGLFASILEVLERTSPRGFLILNGRPLTDLEIARLTGGQAYPGQVSELLNELLDSGVLAIDPASGAYVLPLFLARRRSGVPAWLRRAVMDRCGHKCLHCGSEKDLQIDHIIAFAHGGDESDGNLQVLCRKCNMAKGPHHGKRRPR
jgi:hypothetical protein